MHRLRAAAALLTSLAAAAPGLTPQAASADAAAGPALTVNPFTGLHLINRDIYGMNFADPALEKELKLPVDR